METIWLSIQEVLRNTVNPGLYGVWLKPLQGRYGDGVLTVRAPSEFVANCVETRLSEELLTAAETVLGQRPRLVVQASGAGESEKHMTRQTAPRGANGSGPRPAPRPAQLGLPLRHKEPEGCKQNWLYTFRDFVVGPCNELAFVASKSLCAESASGMDTDQLFISAAPGLGKTHLLHAVGAHLSEQSSGRTVRLAYLTGEEFARQMVFALKAHEIERFKARFRDNVDLLLLEDVQFFQGKERMQDELLATLKSLQTKGAKVIFTSSLLPREFRDLDSQLASRFCSGLLARIERPDFETRRRILCKKASSFQVQIPEDVTNLLAERVKDDVRQLESCLKSLILKARLLNQAITSELAWQVLGDFALETPVLSMERIVDFVCDSFEIPHTKLKSKSRQRQIVLARNMAFYMARTHTELSLKDIGDRFNRKHSTVLKGINNVERELSLETPLGRQLQRTMEMVKHFSSSH
jgi:chromosomal replication initiator protein